MKRILTVFIFFTVYSGVRAQAQDCSVVLNHFYISVDSTTYQEILNSEILNSNFAYSYEKKKYWEGIYIFGKDSYIEIFHPNSIPNEYLPIGFSWVCNTSLVANCTENYKLPDNDLISYYSDENFDELSVFTQDSIYKSNDHGLFTTREMNKGLYESWKKKKYHDSLKFQTTDYNDQAESDSSKNYLFKNVTGIEVNLNNRDSISVTQYLNLIGYTVESKGRNSLRFTNSIDFIELHFSNSIKLATISMIHFDLNQYTEPKKFLVGDSEIEIKGDTGKWKIN